MDRRNFLTSAFVLGSSLTIYQSNVFALPSQVSNQKVLVVFLRGAYDGLNLLIPHNDSFYYEARPNIGVKKDLLKPIDSSFSLNPAVHDILYPMFQQKEITFIHAAGSVDNSRSHFHAQDVMEYGIFDNSSIYNKGFLYRLYQQLDGKKSFPMSYTSNLPLILKGDNIVPNVSLKSNNKFNPDDRQTNLYEKLYQKSDLSSLQKESIQMAHEINNELKEEMNSASKDAISAKGFSLETHKMAQFMKNQQGISIGFIDVGGWDTHVQQGNHQGNLPNNLKNLSQGLSTFKDNLGDQWKDTTVIVISEFGRTVRENGNQGTDHGHGNVVWVLGGNINGGKVSGEWNGLSQNTLHENRDLPVLNDYRSIIAQVLKEKLELSKNQLNTIFPGYSYKNFNI